MDQDEKAENNQFTQVTPAPCPQVNDAVIKSGFALRSSAVHCYKVMSLHLPGKADIEVSNRGRRQKKTQTESLKGGKEALIPGGSQSPCELLSCTDRRWRKTRPRPGAYRPRVLEPALHFMDMCAPHSQQTHPRSGLLASCDTRYRSIHTGRPPWY